MVEACKRLIKVSSSASGSVLTEEERNLVSVAYKNIVGARRSAYRILTNIQNKADESESPEHKKMMEAYKEKIRTELNSVCEDVIHQIDESLLPKVGDEDVKSKVFYLKMKADYYRYLVEAATEETRGDLAKKSAEAYESAHVHANDLDPTNPIRLGLALNYSVYYFEIDNNPTKACELAKAAFDHAIAELDKVKDDSYKDSTLIMQLLRDNLTLWTADQDDDE